ncbi:hypothetical protein Kpho02_65950 [Kitasatospora phosalacinea]|uniref:Uncharacterized protein n=1 Tax=Kitasatospora phosalacinea TaxID=2065 RepID=A0A9W6V6I9_9ACTN|nr:hypothetical protein Kpho02_65950 [Kitasatospora phosalacinea]
MPISRAKPSSVHGALPAVRSTTASTRTTASIAPSPASAVRRAPNRSATAPPNSSSAVRGTVTAVSTSPAVAPPYPAAVQPRAVASAASPTAEARVPASHHRYVRGSAAGAVTVVPMAADPRNLDQVEGKPAAPRPPPPTACRSGSGRAGAVRLAGCATTAGAARFR